MVYETDFYTTRRPYSSRPVVSSYSVSTPRYDLVTERPGAHRSHNSSDYSYQYKSEVKNNSSSDASSYRPQRSSYSSTVERSARSGPGGYNYTTERASTAGSGPGGYSYSSTTSGRLPGGTTYRHWSYRV